MELFELLEQVVVTFERLRIPYLITHHSLLTDHFLIPPLPRA